jgi:uncharacterized protein
MEDESFQIEATPIFDNVHGFIYLNKCEWQIINSQPFQRLRNISQLGLVNYVFPGANHDRFSHSIGVCFLAGEMVKKINEKLAKRKKDSLDEKCIRLAALLHDIGHYPYSHTIESVIKNHTPKGGIPLKGGTESPDFSKSHSHKLNSDTHGYDDFAHHERIATLVINHTEIKDILKSNGITDAEIRKICQIISGKYDGYEKSLIHSELDADRFDYLLRDSHNTGVIYGKFDVKQIIRHLDIYIDDSKEDADSALVVHKKGQKAVEDYLIARYFLYSTVIYQKTNIAFNKMVVLAYEGLLERGLVIGYKQILDIFDSGDITQYLHYDDNYVISQMRSFLMNDFKEDNEASMVISKDNLKELISMILSRNPMKQVQEAQVIQKKDTSREPWKYSLDPVKEKICSELKLDPFWYFTSDITVNITSINLKESILEYHKWVKSKDEILKIYDKPNKKPYPLATDKSSIICLLDDQELIIRGLYVKIDPHLTKEGITARINHIV